MHFGAGTGQKHFMIAVDCGAQVRSVESLWPFLVSMLLYFSKRNLCGSFLDLSSHTGQRVRTFYCLHSYLYQFNFGLCETNKKGNAKYLC